MFSLRVSQFQLVRKRTPRRRLCLKTSSPDEPMGWGWSASLFDKCDPAATGCSFVHVEARAHHDTHPSRSARRSPLPTTCCAIARLEAWQRAAPLAANRATPTRAAYARSHEHIRCVHKAQRTDHVPQVQHVRARRRLRLCAHACARACKCACSCVRVRARTDQRTRTCAHMRVLRRRWPKMHRRR